MCTVTILRSDDRLRVVCNRDERRDRPEAHPPFIMRAGSMLVLTPQDPKGGGTWIAANGAGIVFALLNSQIAAVAPPVRISRGLVIPSLVDCRSLDEVSDRIEGVAAADFAPFRLLAADERNVVEFTFPEGDWNAAVIPLARPRLFTSSSLGDALVDGPRRQLFEEMICSPGDLAAQQDAFHAHRWRDQPAVSVHMSRPDACTVSTTVVEVTARSVRMVYHPAHCDDAGIPLGLVIDREPISPRPIRRLEAGADVRAQTAQAG